MIAWSAQAEPGELIRVDGKTFRRLSSCIARSRLRHIIAADRAAVSLGQWVPKAPWRVQWRTAGVLKPVYRWQVRR